MKRQSSVLKVTLEPVFIPENGIIGLNYRLLTSIVFITYLKLEKEGYILCQYILGQSMTVPMEFKWVL